MALESDGFDDRIGHFFDAHFFVLAHYEKKISTMILNIKCLALRKDTPTG